MIKFFRKIRYDLMENPPDQSRRAGKTGKYFKYAIGEIILVVIGIVIALQLNNWNENRKTENRFRAVLQQIYAVIDQDIEQLILVQYGLNKQITIIDSLIYRPESINPKLLPHLLFYTDLVPTELSSEVTYHLDFLNFNPVDLEQSTLNKSLASYGNNIDENFNSGRKYVTSFLENLNLPIPSIRFGYSVLNNYENIDTTYFNNIEIELATKLLENSLFQNALKSSRSEKAFVISFIEDQINLAKTNLTAIRNYYPEAKLLYSNIGLIGAATQNNSWDKNAPLKLTNPLESIWEGDVILDNGFVKFREGENWYFNWGGDEFPKGNILSYGENIPVKSGKYRIILNLSEKTYRFIKQDN